MKKMKRKLLSLLMVSLFTLSAVIPAQAAEYAYLEVYKRGAFATMSAMTWDLYGSEATVEVWNEGQYATDAAVTYELYGMDNILIEEGTVVSAYWERESDYRDEQYFSGTFTTDSPGFYLIIHCSYNGLACEGRATIEVN